jgi:hypothetical protein
MYGSEQRTVADVHPCCMTNTHQLDEMSIKASEANLNNIVTQIMLDEGMKTFIQYIEWQPPSTTPNKTNMNSITGITGDKIHLLVHIYSPLPENLTMPVMDIPRLAARIIFHCTKKQPFLVHHFQRLNPHPHSREGNTIPTPMSYSASVTKTQERAYKQDQQHTPAVNPPSILTKPQGGSHLPAQHPNTEMSTYPSTLTKPQGGSTQSALEQKMVRFQDQDYLDQRIAAGIAASVNPLLDRMSQVEEDSKKRATDMQESINAMTAIICDSMKTQMADMISHSMHTSSEPSHPRGGKGQTSTNGKRNSSAGGGKSSKPHNLSYS